MNKNIKYIQANCNIGQKLFGVRHGPKYLLQSLENYKLLSHENHVSIVNYDKFINGNGNSKAYQKLYNVYICYDNSFLV